MGIERIYFVDLDKVVVYPGWPPKLIPGALEKLQTLSQDGRIWFFSCWALGEEQLAFLKTLGIPFGFLPKPLADEYIVIDDKLNTQLSRTSL